jgi:DNA-binding GntR family transcriptional regulator
VSIEDVTAVSDILAPYQKRFAHLSRAADVIRETLREAILDSRFEPGARLREEELASYFGVSRTPVREALQVLRTEGIIEFSPNQGARVATLTTDDILALYLVREVLEGLAARLAAVRMKAAQRQQLLDILAEMEDATARNDPDEIADLNLKFHAQLRMAANNPYLNRFLEQVEHAVRRFGQTTFSYPGRIGTSMEEHRLIIDAVLSGDPAEAERVAIEHMQTARQLRLQMLIEGL